ncbi:MAG TPA: hypothetical protein VMW79_10730 [Anaerolineae bacterium]|nr:hypothetical protein [Anaerolineae bacterium]
MSCEIEGYCENCRRIVSCGQLKGEDSLFTICLSCGALIMSQPVDKFTKLEQRIRELEEFAEELKQREEKDV